MADPKSTPQNPDRPDPAGALDTGALDTGALESDAADRAPVEREPSGAESVAAAVLREVLATPALREILSLQLGELGQGGAQGAGPALVKAALRADPALWLSLSSAGPAVAEQVAHSLVALGRELGRLPAPLMEAYLGQLAAQLRREPLRELPRVWAPLLGKALPGVLNLAFEGVAGVSVALAELPPDQREAALGAWAGGLDARRAAGALNAVCELVLTVRRDAPGALGGARPEAPGGARPGALGGALGGARPEARVEARAEARGVDWDALLDEVDFGRLREALLYLSGRGRAAVEPVLARLLSDPVAIANLVGLVPHVLNDGLGLAEQAVARLELPDEVLASAVFNVLRALDLGAAARLLGDAAQTVNALHRGSATLGLEEPAFVAVFSELLDGLLDQLDAEAVARAAVALGEDADVMARVLARRLASRPDLAKLGVETGARLADQALQTALGVVRELGHLNPDTRAALLSRLRQGDGESLVALGRHGAELAEALWPEGDPPGWAAGLQGLLEYPPARALLYRGAAELARTVVAEGWRRVLAEPELVGQQLTRWLRRLSDALEQSGPARESWLRRALGAVERDELGRAWRHAARLAGRSVWPPALLGRARPSARTAARRRPSDDDPEVNS